jgi:crotonobetainyl-CoA hydratase
VFAAIKEVARETEGMPFPQAMRRIMQRGFPTVATLYASADQLEGAKAFAEKRAPVWRGR